MTTYQRTSLALASAMIVLAGCTGSVTDDDTADANSSDAFILDGDIESVRDLSIHPRDDGHTVVAGSAIEQSIFNAISSELLIDNNPIQVFEFETEDAAEDAVDELSVDGMMLGDTAIDFAAEPHFYQSGPVVALYIGTDEVMLDLMEDAMGAQVAGGSTDDEDIGTGSTMDSASSF